MQCNWRVFTHEKTLLNDQLQEYVVHAGFEFESWLVKYPYVCARRMAGFSQQIPVPAYKVFWIETTLV